MDNNKINELRYLEENGRYYFLAKRKPYCCSVLVSPKHKNKVTWQSSSAQKLLKKLLCGQLLKEETKFSFWESKAN